SSRDAATDARGRYRFEGVPAGTYTVIAFRDGFTASAQELKVGAGEVTFDFTLSPAGFSEEVTVSFTGEHATTALKSDAAERDTPFTIKSYTNSFIRAIDTKQVAELYTYMNGISRTGNGAYDTTIRGFTAGEDRKSVV